MLRRLALAGPLALAIIALLPMTAPAAPAAVVARPNKASFRSPVGFNNAENLILTNKTSSGFTAGTYEVGFGDGFSAGNDAITSPVSCYAAGGGTDSGSTIPLAAGASCTLRVKWLAPATPGRYMGTAIVTFNAGAIRIDIPLFGRAF